MSLEFSSFRILGFGIGIFGAKEKPRYEDRGGVLKRPDTKGLAPEKVSTTRFGDCAEQIR